MLALDNCQKPTGKAPVLQHRVMWCGDFCEGLSLAANCSLVASMDGP